MRKFYFALSLSVILAVLLAACGSTNNATPTPTATPAPLPTTAPLGTEAPGGLPGTGATGTAVTGAGGAASTTEAPMGTATTAAVAAASTPGALANSGLGFNISSITNMLTFPVVDQNDTQVGTVNDLVLNLCTAHVDYVIVTLNGNLPSTAPGAMGTATMAVPELSSTGTPVAPGSAAATATGPNGAGSIIAIPWDVLTVVNENSFFNSGSAGASSTSTPAAGGAATGTATAAAPASAGSNGPGEFVLANTVTPEMLTGAPTFDKNTATQSGVFSASWDTALRTYWGITSRMVTPAGCVAAAGSATSTAMAPGAASTGTAVAPGAAVTGTPAASGSTGSSNPVLTGIDLTVLAHTFLNATVNAQGGNNIGTVSDGIVLPTSGLIRFLVVNPTAALSLNGKVVPVPTHAFSYNNGAMSAAGTATPGAGASMTGSSNIVLTLNVPNSVLQNAPTLDPNNMPDMTVPGWDVNILNYWTNQNVVVPN